MTPSVLSVTLHMQDHAHLTPLASGDVHADGITFVLNRDTPAKRQDRSGADPTINAGELSLARHIVRVVGGDRSWVAIPVFPLRHFVHRMLYVRRGGGIRKVTDLAGARIGLRDWAATGSVWIRAVLRLEGVQTEEVRWAVGPIESVANRPRGASVSSLPGNVQPIPAERSLVEMLLAGELDAIVSGDQPIGSASANHVVRLLSDFREAERSFYRRYRVYPAHHVVGVRRSLYEQVPWILSSLFDALERSRTLWLDSVRVFHDATPWMLAELEETAAAMGPDWSPNDVEPNVPMLGMLTEALAADGLIRRRLDAAEVFAEFQKGRLADLTAHESLKRGQKRL